MKNLLILFFFIALFTYQLPDTHQAATKVIKVNPMDIIGKCFSGEPSFSSRNTNYKPYVKIVKKEENFFIAQYFFKQRDTIRHYTKKITKDKLLKKVKVPCPNQIIKE